MTVRENIWADLMGAVNTGRPGGVPAAVLWKADPVDDAQLPSLAVTPAEDFPDRIGGKRGPVMKREMLLTFEARAKSVTEVEAALAWVTQVLGDRRSALFHELEELGTKWDKRQEQALYIAGTLEFRVSYQTLPANLGATK